MATVDGINPPKTETPLPTSPAPLPTLTASTPKKRKVLYVITKSYFGGAQRYVSDLASHPPAGTEVTVMCGPGQDTLREGFLIRKLAENNVRTIVLPALKRDVGLLDFVAFFRLFQAIRAEAPDVLHLNSSKVGGLGALVGRLCRVPRIIFTAHGWAFNEPQRGVISKTLVWLASVATIVLSHKVICVSIYDRNAFTGWFFQNKLVVIHNALSPDEYEERDSARKNLVPHADLYQKDVWVGSIAELTPNKNISLALDAVAKALAQGCNIFYAVVSDGEERLALEDKIKELKIDQNVRLLGFVSDARRYIKAFDIALLTSRKEGMPYFVLECLSAGVPIIASNVGGISEVIRDGENGILCQSENVDQFADALYLLVKDETVRKQLASSPPQDHFDTMLRETFSLYH
jgi:glycosyltransferase involved in cell wall biosynthesis